MDAIIPGLILVISICLILISMVILRFTMSEEFREIGADVGDTIHITMGEENRWQRLWAPPAQENPPSSMRFPAWTALPQGLWISAENIAELKEKALFLYETYGARLVVLDIMLPEPDGFRGGRLYRKTL